MREQEANPFDPPEKPGARRRRLGYLLIGAVVIIGLAVGTAVYVVNRGPEECGAGVEKQNGECVGVTDGSFVFDPALEAIEGKILAENRRQDGKPAVTVAFLGPLTPKTMNSINPDRVRAQLEGAYLAQRAANAGDANPKIRLVLANEGDQELAWPMVVDKLKAMKDGPEHLVAVIGLSVSIQATADGAAELARNGIPIVAATVAADNLNSTAAGLGHGRIEGFTKVNIDVADEFAAIGRYLSGRPELRTAMLVGDNNPIDLYAASLTNDFKTVLKNYWDAGGQRIYPYNGAPGSQGIRNQFQTIATGLCGVSPPDLVFYAGRASLLPSFITHLRQRQCERGRTITVVSGSDATSLKSVLPPPTESDAKVSVIFSALADPLSLGDPRFNPDQPQYQRFADAFVREGFDPADIADGWAIMTHDSMLAAATAIHRATGQSDVLPTPGGVRDQLYLANAPNTAIPGAGGTFMIDSTSGDVVGRRVPVLELQADGTLVVHAVYPQG
ncbi:hypothetical protein [Amycolatopsis anabasis]|uniref:hypothetical protein n=1 Tax=Amycolatopsis anabasis TaxID=1840409 RepID=UPI00131D8ED3|nr:hypothetical protein [Amycolatopsis anabasis]